MSFYISVGLTAVISLIYISILAITDVPFSRVYRHFHSSQDIWKLAQYKNKVRTTKALDYIYSLPGPAYKTSDSRRQDFDVLVVIVTTARKREQRAQSTGYLLQTAATMHKLMKNDKYFAGKFMFVCNVDENPSEHSDAQELRHYLPFVQKDGQNNLGLNVTHLPQLKGSGLKDEARKREIVDYAFCLNVSLSFNYRYALILEDDVIPHEHLFEVLHHTLKNKLREHPLDHGKDISNRKFSFLKLYFPQRWQGYAFEVVRVLELIAIGALGGAFFTVTLSYFETESPRARKGKPSVSLSFLYGFLCFITLAIIIGRVNIVEFRRLSPQLFSFGPSSACCTQAMLYSREVLRGIIQYLLVNNNLNKDLAIYDYSLKFSMPAFQLEPNLFMHTGMQTSFSSAIHNPEEFLFDIAPLD